MLKRKYRLPARIKLTKAASYKLPSLTLMIAKNDLGLSRFGFIVSKKIDKRAVVRNRIKRVVRSCIEVELEKIVEGYDMLFIIGKNAIRQTREVIYNEIETVLKTKHIKNEYI